MKNNRRDFLRLAGIAGIGLASSDLMAGNAAAIQINHSIASQKSDKSTQQFNMSGYTAPKLETVRIGYIGLGNRGSAAVIRMIHIEGTTINAICDLRREKVDAITKQLSGTIHNPAIYSEKENDWKKLCERDDIDLVYIATPWHLHTPMAVYAMKCNKHVCVEVPAALTIDECWQLVETSESTRRHCMMLENVCYGQFNLLTLNMVRQGLFGEVIHCEGAYIHDLMFGIFSKDKYSDMWRLKQNAHRNGNLYPTHGIGAICQVMDINRGDKLEYLVSMSGNDFMMEKYARELAEQDSFYKPYVGLPYRGNINTTSIRTSKGKTIMLQHDVTTTRPKSLGYMVSGTKATALQFPEPGRISLVKEKKIIEWQKYEESGWLSDDEFKALEEKYNPEILKRIGELAKEIGGHGGMDLLMDWRTIDCLRNGLPLDQDVYDAALWSSIGPLSECSAAYRSGVVDVPDFTRGFWKTNHFVDLSLENGGNTKVK